MAAVVGPTAAAHRGTRLAQHAVNGSVGTAGGSHQGADAGTTLVGTAQLVQQLIPGLVQLLHGHLPAIDDPPHTQRKKRPPTGGPNSRNRLRFSVRPTRSGRGSPP